MQEFPIVETRIEQGPLAISQAMPEAQCVALGIFINIGSRDESESEAGIAHALEHMLFKGTKRHDVHALSEKLDTLGGNANAFTGRERTCFYLTVLHEDWRQGLEILLDMLLHATLPEDEWQRERGVIFSEIGLVEDAPEEWAMDRHLQALFPGSSVGRPTLGSHDSLAGITRAHLQAYLERCYRPPRLLVAAAGRIDHAELVEVLSGRVWPQAVAQPDRPVCDMASGLQLLPRDIEQAYITLSFPGPSLNDADRPIAWVANQMLGGGMSSRLFRTVREERGLAYHVDSGLFSLSDGGAWTISCATDPLSLPDCIQAIEQTLATFSSGQTHGDELARAVRQLQVQMRMGMDSVESQMLRLAARFDEPVVQLVSHWLEAVGKVEAEQVNEWKAAHLVAKPLWSICGPVEAVKKAGSCLHP
ncbi:MAG: pitrilysin family protein [Mariprofundaceae bacterium]